MKSSEPPKDGHRNSNHIIRRGSNKSSSSQLAFQSTDYARDDLSRESNIVPRVPHEMSSRHRTIMTSRLRRGGRFALDVPFCLTSLTRVFYSFFYSVYSWKARTGNKSSCNNSRNFIPLHPPILVVSYACSDSELIPHRRGSRIRKSLHHIIMRKNLGMSLGAFCLDCCAVS